MKLKEIKSKTKMSISNSKLALPRFALSLSLGVI